MGRTARAQFLFCLSSCATILFTHVSSVKSVHVVNIDRVLPFHSNHHQKNIVNDAKQLLQISKNSIFSPSKMDPLEHKMSDIHSIEGKNFVTNEIIPRDLETDRTFKIFGHSLSQILKNNEQIFENTLGPLRPGTVDDVKSVNPQHYGHHMAIDIDTYMKKPPNSYKAPVPDTFKAPDVSYEGFIPCSPPKCRRIPPTPKKVVSTPVYHTTTPSYKLLATKATTKVPTVYRTTTQHTSYTKPTENIQLGYLVDHHSNNEISNVPQTGKFETPNLYKTQPSKGKHQHNQGYDNVFHPDEFGHQLVDLVKPDYKYVHHEEGVNSVHPDPHHLPNSTWIFHDVGDNAHPLHDGDLTKDIEKHPLVDSNNNPHEGNFGHQLIDLHIKDYKYVQNHSKPRENGHQANSLDTHAIQPLKEHTYHGIDGTVHPPPQVINLIKDDYNYVHKEQKTRDNSPYRTIKPTPIIYKTTTEAHQWEEIADGFGHQIVDLIKDDYHYTHNETGHGVPGVPSNDIVTPLAVTKSPFGNLNGEIHHKEVGHQLVDLIKDDYAYVHGTNSNPSTSIHENLPSFVRVKDGKATTGSFVQHTEVDNQLVDLIKDDYEYVRNENVPQTVRQPLSIKGFNNQPLITPNSNQNTNSFVNNGIEPSNKNPNSATNNEFEPSFPAYGDDYNNKPFTLYGDDYIDFGTAVQSNTPQVNTPGSIQGSTGSFFTPLKDTEVNTLKKQLAAINAVLAHRENERTKTKAKFSKPTVLTVHNPPIHAAAFQTEVQQQEHTPPAEATNSDAFQTKFRQEEHTNLGNQASLISQGNAVRQGKQTNPGITFVPDEHLMLSNNIPKPSSPQSIDVTSNIVTFENNAPSTTVMNPNEIAALFSSDDQSHNAPVRGTQPQQTLSNQMHNKIPFKTNHPFPAKLLADFMRTQSAMKDGMLIDAVSSPKPRRPKQIIPNTFSKGLPSMKHLKFFQKEFGKNLAHFPLWREDFRAMPQLKPSKIPQNSNANFVHQSPIGRPLKFRRGMRPKFKKGLKKVVKFKVHSITGQLVPVDTSIPQPVGTTFFSDNGHPIEQPSPNHFRQGKQINAFRPRPHPSLHFINTNEISTLHSHSSNGLPSNVHHPHKPRPPSSFAFISQFHGKRNKRRNHKHHVV